MDPNKDCTRPDTVGGSVWEDFFFFFFYGNSNGKKWIRNPVIERCVYWTDGRTGQNEPYAKEGIEV